ncbi:MAG: LemA family protein [Cytophagales bacterium]
MKSSYILLGLVGLLVIFGFYGCNVNNSLVEKDTEVKKQWGQVEVQYQRRSDLIGNLIKTVEAEANFEKSTLKEIIEARANATKVTLNVDDLSEENIAKIQKAQEGLSGALGRLLMVTENYPNLKTNAAFGELRVALEGTENRIAEERRKYNDVVGNFNIAVRKFPASIFAGMFGFKTAGFFHSDAGTENAPKVEFNIK